MFSYLQAIAQAKKKTNLIGSHLVSSLINTTLVTLLVLPSTVFIVNLQFTILILELITITISLPTNLYIGELLIKDINNKKYATLLAMVGLHSAINKHRVINKLYSILSVTVVAVTMVSIGWIGQAVFFILASVLSVSTLYDFLDQLPTFVEGLGLNENDITV